MGTQKALGLALIVLMALGVAVQVAPVAASGPSITNVIFTSLKFGTETCPDTSIFDPYGGIECGEQASHISVVAAKQTVTITFTIANAQPGWYTTQVREDIISESDNTLLTLNAYISSANIVGGSVTVSVGSFVPPTGTVGPNGVWPLDIGALREYYIRVFFGGQTQGGTSDLIYNPTQTVAVWGFIVPFYATEGRPAVQAICPNGNAPTAVGGCF